MRKEKDELNTVKTNLEKRLGDAQLKAEKVKTLETEKARFLEKERHMLESMDSLKEQLTVEKRKGSELLEKVTMLESQPTQTPTSRESVTTPGGHRLSKGGLQSLLKKGKGGSSKAPETPSGMPATKSEVEMYQGIIEHLQGERMRMKKRSLLERMNKLQSDDGEFNRFMREDQQPVVRGGVSLALT